MISTSCIKSKLTQFSDFLLVILRSILPQRPDLKLILMSATLNAEIFASYFNQCPTLTIPGFTHPVKEYFLEDVVGMTDYQVTQGSKYYKKGSGESGVDYFAKQLPGMNF